MLHEKLTENIIKCFYTVYNNLGYGFLESVYEKALLMELRKSSIKCQRQLPINVYYNGEVVGNFFADIIVEDKVILEIKAISRLKREHEIQILNYLKATEIEIGLVLNFGDNPQIKRKIYTNNRKKHLD